MVEQKILDDFVGAIKQEPVEKNNIHSAEVSRIDNEGTVWVRVAGSEKETPTASSSAEVKKGDAVNVEWRNNKLYIAGNYSNPSAGVARVSNVEAAAQVARQAASNAVADAGVAREAATRAVDTANSVSGIAEQAQEDAGIANQAATSAIAGMDLVQRVVDVANWIAEHGEYDLTTDSAPVDGKFYFIKHSDNTYSVVSPGSEDNPAENGWYEVTSIDEAVSNFINAHMVLTSDGLVLKKDNVRIDLSTQQGEEGVIIWSGNKKVASYGEKAIIGDKDGFHLKVSSDELGFYNGNVEVAYLNGQKLYITQSVVLEQMDVGRRTGEVDPISGNVGKGLWSWKVHAIQGANNLYLKWIG